MKRMRGTLLLIACVLFLAGCSNGEKGLVKSDGTVIYTSGKQVDLSEHSGSSAVKDLKEIGEITYYLCDSLENCSHNQAGIFVEDMTKYKKGSYYYTMYLETEIYLYVPRGKGYIECYAKLKDVGKMSVDLAVDTMYNTAKKLLLSETIRKISFRDKVEINVENYDFKVREKEVVIPGLLRVYEDTGKIKTEETVTVGEKTLGKVSSVKYDYYQYDGVILQTASGTILSDLVRLK